MLPIVVMGGTDAAAIDHKTPTKTAIAREGFNHVDDLEVMHLHRHVLQVDQIKKTCKKRKLFEFLNTDETAKRIRLSTMHAHCPLTVTDNAGKKLLNGCAHCDDSEMGRKENTRTAACCNICGVCLCTEKKENKRKTCIEQ